MSPAYGLLLFSPESTGGLAESSSTSMTIITIDIQPSPKSLSGAQIHALSPRSEYLHANQSVTFGHPRGNSWFPQNTVSFPWSPSLGMAPPTHLIPKPGNQPWPLPFPHPTHTQSVTKISQITLPKQLFNPPATFPSSLQSRRPQILPRFLQLFSAQVPSSSLATYKLIFQLQPEWFLKDIFNHVMLYIFFNLYHRKKILLFNWTCEPFTIGFLPFFSLTISSTL